MLDTCSSSKREILLIRLISAGTLQDGPDLKPRERAQKILSLQETVNQPSLSFFM
jgi:hypothetical protein